MKLFKRDRIFSSDVPVEVNISQVIEKIYNMVSSVRRFRVHELVENRDLFHGSVLSILHINSWPPKSITRWLPRLLTLEGKQNCVIDSVAGWAPYRGNSDDILRPFINIETRFIHYTPDKT